MEENGIDLWMKSERQGWSTEYSGPYKHNENKKLTYIPLIESYVRSLSATPTNTAAPA